jgi:hypothetical protein
MSDLQNRIEKLEAREGLKPGMAGLVVTFPTDDPDQVTVNGERMTRAEVNEYAAKHNLAILTVVYLPDNGRSTTDEQP